MYKDVLSIALEHIWDATIVPVFSNENAALKVTRINQTIKIISSLARYFLCRDYRSTLSQVLITVISKNELDLTNWQSHALEIPELQQRIPKYKEMILPKLQGFV